MSNGKGTPFQNTFTNMSDSQLRHTISQLSAVGANMTHPAVVVPAPKQPPVDQFRPYSPAPQDGKAKAYGNNLHKWATSSTPNPRASTGGGATPRTQRSTRATKSSNLANASKPSASPRPYTPVYQVPIPAPQQQQQQQPYPPHYPAQPAPNPPRAPLSTSTQALHSTYASRLRTGTTLLVQPVLASQTTTIGGGRDRGSTRRGGIVNYVDPGSGDELEFVAHSTHGTPDAGDRVDSDDSDFVGSRTALRQGRSRVSGGMGVFQAAAAVNAPRDKMELDQSYLGMVPPARFIKAKQVGPTAHDYPSQMELEVHSQNPISLVPIRVEFETDTLRVRDCFVWNIYETLITPLSFARIFCADLDLPTVPWAETVANQIRAQLDDFGEGGVGGMDVLEQEGECRVILSIDVQIATYHLLDHIEWDLLSGLTPEEFSQKLCLELGLSGEAIGLISHAIHEEIVKHKKDAIEWGVMESDTVTEVARDKSGSGLMKDKTGLGLGWGRAPKEGRGPKVLKSVWRDWADSEEFKTRFEVLSAEEVERREIEKERASRRLRRETSKFQSSTRTRRR